MKRLYITIVLIGTGLLKGYCQTIAYVVPGQVEKVLSKSVDTITSLEDVFVIWDFNPEINKISLSLCNHEKLPENYKNVIKVSNRYLKIDTHQFPIVLPEDFRFSSYILCDGCVVRAGGFPVMYDISYTIKGLNNFDEIIE